MSDFFRIDPRIMQLAEQAEQIAAQKFAEIDANAAYNGKGACRLYQKPGQ